MQQIKYSKITGAVIGASFDVYNYLGRGFQEKIYQRALAYELETRGIPFARELGMAIYYKDCDHSIGSRYVDFLVDDKVVVELKATPELTDAHIAQTLNYLKIWRIEVGLLINFGAKSVEFKRLILSPNKHPFQHQVQPISPGDY